MGRALARTVEIEMRDKARVRIVAGVVLALTAPSTSPHHSFAAQFDAEKPIKLVGTVTSIEWQNPHTWFYVDVKDDNGNVASWGMELASPNLLMRNGWTRSSMKIGDSVTVEGFHARDGSNTGNARVVILNATGQSLFAGSNAPRSAQ
jgi:hypothetical protein